MNRKLELADNYSCCNRRSYKTPSKFLCHTRVGDFVSFSITRIQLIVRHLIFQQRYEEAATKILDFTLQIQSQDQWKPLLNCLQLVPENVRLSSARVAASYATVLMGNRLVPELLEFTDSVAGLFDDRTNAQILVDRAFALIIQNKHTESQTILFSALPYLEDHLRGVALRRLGISQFRLQQNWQFYFQEALKLQQGRAYGLTLLDYAACQAIANQPDVAQQLYTQALFYFKRDYFYLAWLRFNLGNNALRIENPEAEQHFLIAEHLTRKPQAKGLRSAVLRGLASFRRSKGEFARAEFLLHQAIACAIDLDDDLAARQGLARTLRLAGQVGTALEVIEAAIFKHGSIPTLLVTRAMTLLALGLNALCQKDLDNAVPLANVNSQQLAIVARAELELRAENNQKAHDLLQEIPLNTLQMREERRAFPSLFALLESPPITLEYIVQTKVEIVALGVLQVKVNQRPVPISPTSRIGELLVFILEQGGTASLEQITDALYADALSELEKNRARKAIWKLTRDLRLALGWQNSIASLRSAYQLDPSAIWDYDARDTTAKINGFLNGIYSNWVLEKTQEYNH